MAFTPVEIIALLFIILGMVKFLVNIFSRKTWYTKVVKPIYVHKISGAIIGILAFVCLYYLLQELTIVQIIASMAFTSLVIVLAFSFYWKELQPAVEKMYNKSLSFGLILYAVIWLALMCWALWVMFGEAL